MSERTTVVNRVGGSDVTILANVVVTVLILAAVLWLGANVLVPSQINVDVNQPNNLPAQPQPQPQQPASSIPTSYRLVLPGPTA